MTPLARQRNYDDSRVTYRLIFPAGLSDERVAAWLNSLGGTMHIDHSRILGVPSIVFETEATDTLISHYLPLPKRDAGYIIGHLESLVPGIHAEAIKELPSYTFTEGAELHMTTASRTLSLSKPNDVAATILTSLQGLRENEVVVVQWIVTPAQHAPMPSHKAPPKSDNWSAWRAVTAKDQATAEEIEDRRAKLGEPNMQAIGRIGVVAPHSIRAQEITKQVVQAYRSVGSASNKFFTKWIKHSKLGSISGATTPFFFTSQFSLSELVPLVAWPLGSPYIAGLPSSRTRHMHVTNAVPRDGTIIGTSTVPGSTRTIGIDIERELQHSRIIGPTSSGKTWLAVGKAVQNMQDGNSVVVIDPKGDLYQRVLERIPDSRVNDVIVWDLADIDFPIGFNVLRQGSHRGAIDELNSLVTNLFPESLSTPQVMYHGLHALAEGGTFVDLPSMIKPGENERRWRDKVIRSIADKQIKQYWETYLADEASKSSRGDVEAATLARRIWPFVSRAEIRNSLGQLDSTFTMPDLVENSKILLVHLNGVRIGKQAASLMGTLILNALYSAVRTRRMTPEGKPESNPVMLYMDEFQNFVTMPTDPGDMLAESRSFGLGMNLIHQNLDQLSDRGLRAAISSNCRTQIAFQLAGDSQAMAREFGSKVSATDLENLQHREAIAKVATAAGVSEAFTFRTITADKPSGNLDRVIAQSRARYGRPVAEVEAEIAARRSVGTAPPTDGPLYRRKLNQRNEGDPSVS